MPVSANWPTPAVLPSNGAAPAPVFKQTAATTRAAADPDQLAQRLVRAGDGHRRSSVLTHRERAKRGFKAAGLALAGVLLGVPLAVPVLLFEGAVWLSGRIRRDRTGTNGNQGAAANAGLPDHVMLALMKEQGGGIDAKAHVMEALHCHARNMKSPLAPEEITELVRAGQHIALALRQPAPEGADSGAIVIDGATVRCNAWLARAVSWYLMAVAAAQDVAAAPEPLADGADTVRSAPPSLCSDLVTNGSMVLRDPGQRLYWFLRGSVLSGPRPSTHFADKSASGEPFKWLGIFPGSSPQQFGIEDMRSRFPGQGGALLFDTLREPADSAFQLFVKFEKAGCPPLLLREDASRSARIAYSIAAVHRNIAHVLNYGTTRLERKHDADRVERMEHVHKGSLKRPLYEPFVALVEDAIGSGLIAPEYKTILQGVETHGLPFLAATVDAIHDIAEKAAGRLGTGKSKGSARHLDATRAMRSAQRLAARFDAVMQQFGETLPGVARKGAEVHLDLEAAQRDVYRSPKAPTPAVEPPPQWHPPRTRPSRA